MADRVVREGWLESERIKRLKPLEEIFFLRLMLIADDWGRAQAEPDVLARACFPLKSDLRSSVVGNWIDALEDHGLIRRYHRIRSDGTQEMFLEIRRFWQRIRHVRSQFPEPPWCSEAEEPMKRRRRRKIVFGGDESFSERFANENHESSPSEFSSGEQVMNESEPNSRRAYQTRRERWQKRMRAKIKISQRPPEEWTSQRLIAKWKEWVKHMEEIRPPFKTSSQTYEAQKQSLCDMLVRRGEESVLDSMEWSIQNGRTIPIEPPKNKQSVNAIWRNEFRLARKRLRESKTTQENWTWNNKIVQRKR